MAKFLSKSSLPSWDRCHFGNNVAPVTVIGRAREMCHGTRDGSPPAIPQLHGRGPGRGSSRNGNGSQAARASLRTPLQQH